MSDQKQDDVGVPLARAAVHINRIVTYGQAAALVAIALAAVTGIFTVIWGMVSTRTAQLPDLLLLFLFISIIAMVKGCALGTREAPIRTPVTLAIVATCRSIMVEVDQMSPTLTLFAALAILVLVCALWILNRLKL